MTRCLSARIYSERNKSSKHKQMVESPQKASARCCPRNSGGLSRHPGSKPKCAATGSAHCFDPTLRATASTLPRML
eukprot:m.593252 g.593252  ORF g.593252 m.593252 type:complete len:76 (+) comp58025_c0_seq25:700-927(+)